MLLAGDEIGRTQKGNNNTYCQDNELNWVNWDVSKEDKALFQFVRCLIRLRKNHPAFRRRYFFQGRDIVGAGVKDITWLTPLGEEMTDEEWNQSFARCLGLFLAGSAIEEYDDRGNLVKDDNLILLLNSHHETIPFTLPAEPANARWEVLVDTSVDGDHPADGRFYHTCAEYPLKKRSFVLLRQQKRQIFPHGSEETADSWSALPSVD
jgi:glycogen operon protein